MLPGRHPHADVNTPLTFCIDATRCRWALQVAVGLRAGYASKERSFDPPFSLASLRSAARLRQLIVQNRATGEQ